MKTDPEVKWTTVEVLSSCLLHYRVVEMFLGCNCLISAASETLPAYTLALAASMAKA